MRLFKLYPQKEKKTTMMVLNANFAVSLHMLFFGSMRLLLLSYSILQYIPSLELTAASCLLLMSLSFHRSRVLGLKELLNKHLSVQVSCMHTSLRAYMQAEIRATSFHCCWNRSSTDVEALPIIDNIPSV